MGKKFKTLKEARALANTNSSLHVMKLNGKVFKFWVGTEFEWLNLK